MAQPLNPTDLLTGTLEAQQWNQVLALVGEGPYRIVAPIIETLQQQLHAQAQPDNFSPMDEAVQQQLHTQTHNVFPMEAG